jgi:hypothetical protein
VQSSAVFDEEMVQMEPEDCFWKRTARTSASETPQAKHAAASEPPDAPASTVLPSIMPLSRSPASTPVCHVLITMDLDSCLRINEYGSISDSAYAWYHNQIVSPSHATGRQARAMGACLSVSVADHAGYDEDLLNEQRRKTKIGTCSCSKVSDTP